MGEGILAGSTRNKRSKAHDDSEEKEASKRVWIRAYSFSSQAMNLLIFVYSDILRGSKFKDDKVFIG